MKICAMISTQIPSAQGEIAKAIHQLVAFVVPVKASGSRNWKLRIKRAAIRHRLGTVTEQNGTTIIGRWQSSI